MDGHRDTVEQLVSTMPALPRDGVTTSGAKTFAAISAGSTPNRAPPTRSTAKIEITQVSSLSFARSAAHPAGFCGPVICCPIAATILFSSLRSQATCSLLQDGHSIELRQSQMCLMDMSVQGGVAFNDGNQFTSTRIPRRELLSMCPDAENMLARPLTESPRNQRSHRTLFRAVSGRRPHHWMLLASR